MKELRKYRPDLYRALKNSPLNARLSVNFGSLRGRSKLTDDELAKKAGLSIRDFKRMNECQPYFSATLDVVERLAKTLGVKPEELLRPVNLLKS